MGHLSPSLEEELSMSQQNNCGSDVPTKGSDEFSLKEKESSDGAGLLKRGSDSQAYSEDMTVVALPDFLDLASRQVSVEPATKRMKISAMGPDIYNVDAIMKHVADIVLVLAGLGLLRGGRNPTDEERRLQAEAYGHLGLLVQELDPRDLVSPNVVENLIEDLGLRKSRDQEVKTFAEILESFQPPASIQADEVDHMHNGNEMADELGLEEPDPQKFLLSGNNFEGEGSLYSSLSMLGQENFVLKNVEAGGPDKQFTQAIQDLLKPRLPADYQFQAAYPRMFMNAAMPCEMCKMIVRETSNVLVCDTCEKVFHLRCLQSYLLMGIPKGDWYCPKCSGDSEEGQERRQEPKYGRVKAGFSFSKGSFPQEGLPTTNISQKTKHSDTNASKKAMPASVGKVSPAAQKLEDQSNKVSQRLSNHGKLGGSFTALLDSFAQADDPSRPSMLKDGKPVNHILSSHPQVTRTAFQVGQPPMAHLQSQSRTLRSGGGAKVAGSSVPQKNTSDLVNPTHVGAASGSNQSKSTEDSDDTSMGSEDDDSDGPVKEAEVVKEPDRFGIEWVGDVVQKHDEKMYYSACTVGGCLYRLQDCALFRPEIPNVPPYIARLQALWEDTISGSKWVRVNWCYYPADLAVIAGRPPNPESHEVYESNHGDNNLVGTIQGQCSVLQPEQYLKEMERRQELLKSGNTGEGLLPIFLCRWFYDVPSGIFRPSTEAS